MATTLPDSSARTSRNRTSWPRWHRIVPRLEPPMADQSLLQDRIAWRGRRHRSVAAAVQQYGVFVALLALILFNMVVTPNFMSWQTVNVNLTQVCAIVIVAVGMTLVIAA